MLSLFALSEASTGGATETNPEEAAGASNEVQVQTEVCALEVAFLPGQDGVALLHSTQTRVRHWKSRRVLRSQNILQGLVGYNVGTRLEMG